MSYIRVAFEKNDRYIHTMLKNEDFKKIGLTPKELFNYVGTKNFYTWHIDDLKIYDKPKELSEFYSVEKMKFKAERYFQNDESVASMTNSDLVNLTKDVEKAYKRKECRLTKAPQSYQYVEVI